MKNGIGEEDEKYQGEKGFVLVMLAREGKIRDRCK